MHPFFIKLQNAHEEGQFASFIKESAAAGELFEVIPSLKGLDQIPQDPRWHPEGDVWTHTLLVIENLPSHATFATALASLLHDVGKAVSTVIHDDGKISARGHENESRKIASRVLEDLGADPELKKSILFLVFRHMIAHSKDTTKKTVQRLINEAGEPLVEQLLLHGVADVKGGCGDLTECLRIQKLFDEIKEQSLIYTERDSKIGF